MQRMTLPRDNRVTMVTMVAVMAIATVVAFLLLALARAHYAY